MYCSQKFKKICNFVPVVDLKDLPKEAKHSGDNPGESSCLIHQGCGHMVLAVWAVYGDRIRAITHLYHSDRLRLRVHHTPRA